MVSGKTKAAEKRKTRSVDLLEKYSTINGAATILGIARETVYSAVRSGKLVPARLGCGKRVLLISDVTSWNESRAGHGGRPPKKLKLRSKSKSKPTSTAKKAY